MNIVILLISWLLQLGMTLFFQKSILQPFYCLYIITFFSFGYTWLATCLVIVLLSILDFIYHGHFLWNIIFFSMLQIVFIIGKQYLNNGVSLIYYASFLVMIVAHSAFLSLFAPVRNLTIFYTINEICANLILIFVILKYMGKGRLGNRLYAINV